MTITIEQLELAARSAGINIQWLRIEINNKARPERECFYLDNSGVRYPWNPLTDHGQLLDLAMACKMELDFNSGSVCYLVGIAWNAKYFHIGDFHALAEAVILAASEQQLAKEKKE